MMKTNAKRAVMTAILGMLVSAMSMYAQLITVKGKVTDATDASPLPGCAVYVENTNNGVVTDIQGDYTITVNKGDRLAFGYVGYQTKKVVANKATIHVALNPDEKALEEVVTVSYGARKTKKSRQAEIIVVQDQSVSCCYIAPVMREDQGMEEYNSVVENRFQSAERNPLSTFSIDVDVASYSNMRRHLNQGTFPPADAIRTEEFINYFSYRYEQPKGSDPVKISTEVGTCPWNEKHRLVRIGVKAKEVATENMPASNLVFLIDVSGSMYGPTRLELVKSSLKLLVNNLRDKDRVAIVVYAGSAGEVLSSTPGSDKQKIREALDKLTAGGSTAGGAGIQLAYKIAKKNFMEGGNNRVILCTDGDFNVGVSSKEGLESFIEKERKTGVFLTVLGYGMGNYKDNRMQVLSEKGNGNYAYIDNLQEANKVLVHEFGGTLYTVAKDVKLQVEFNPAKVQSYRLIGYESRLLNKEDFNDDTKDAGEMGAGHAVTAFYEIIPVGVKSSFSRSVDDLKYQQVEKNSSVGFTGSKELLTVKLRYKQPAGEVSKKMEHPVVEFPGEKVSSDFRFAAAVAMYGQLLRNSDFKAEATYDKVISLARTALDDDALGYRREFIRLVETAKGLEK